MSVSSARAYSDSDVIRVMADIQLALRNIIPCRHLVRRPSKAGTSLFSSNEPLSARFPNSGTPT
eukprot:5267685-Prorocentrum_lima.AAC.1